jgi:hypothetical protein
MASDKSKPVGLIAPCERRSRSMGAFNTRSVSQPVGFWLEFSAGQCPMSVQRILLNRQSIDTEG